MTLSYRFLFVPSEVGDPTKRKVTRVPPPPFTVGLGLLLSATGRCWSSGSRGRRRPLDWALLSDFIPYAWVRSHAPAGHTGGTTNPSGAGPRDLQRHSRLIPTAGLPVSGSVSCCRAFCTPSYECSLHSQSGGPRPSSLSPVCSTSSPLFVLPLHTGSGV